MTKKILSLLLVFAMLVSMTACGNGGGETTPPTTVPPTTTEPGPDAMELYAAAAEPVRAASSMIVDYTIDTEMTVGTGTYLETEKTHLTLTGLGSDAFAGSASTEYTWGTDYYADASDIFIDGTWYYQVDDNCASTGMTAEAYQAMYLPAVLLTAELYSDVELLGESTVAFSGATELEPWLAQEGFVLVEASGTAVIGSTGKLEDCTYEATYTHMGVEFTVSVSSRARTGELTVEAPYNPDSFPAMENPQALLAYERAIGLAIQAYDVTSTSAESIVIQAGDTVMNQQCTLNSYGAGKDMIATYDTNVSLLTISTGASQYSFLQNERFENGTYTYSVDGGASQPDPQVTVDDMRYYCQAFLGEMFPVKSDLHQFTLKDLGATLLVEYQLNDEAARAYTSVLCGAIYEDANLLDSLASDYRLVAAAGYVGIDKVTGLPLSLGMEYAGYHTIDGSEYMLAYTHSQNIVLDSGSTYKTLTGEMLPVEEPETPATPLLYHVTGANGEEMWLFGTIHVGDERTAYLPDTIMNAFAASDALAVEFDTDAFTEKMTTDAATAALISQCYLYTDGSAVTDHLEDDNLAAKALEILKSTGTYNATMLMMRPVILGQSVENDYIRLSHAVSADMGMDSQLLAMAREQGKQILEVESGEFQMQMLAGYSDALQELLLKEAVEYDAAEYMNEIIELYELWCSGDEEALIAALNETDEDMTEEEAVLFEEYNKAMSTDRNAAMLEVAKGYLNGDTTVFYAVGLAHLLAEDGLVNTLRDAGYTVELVPAA